VAAEPKEVSADFPVLQFLATLSYSTHHVPMKPLALVATLVMLLGLAGPVAAGPFEDALATAQHGDYETALQL
jgi:hypothetical protein